MKPLQNILYVLAAAIVLMLAGAGLGAIVHRLWEAMG